MRLGTPAVMARRRSAVGDRVEHVRAAAARRAPVARERERDLRPEIGHRPGLRHEAGLVVVAPPLAVQELDARRVAPRPDVRLDQDRQLDRPPRATPGAPPRDLEQAIDEGAPLGLGRRSVDHREDIDVARRAEAAEHGRAMQVRADERLTKHVTDDRHDLVGDGRRVERRVSSCGDPGSGDTVPGGTVPGVTRRGTTAEPCVARCRRSCRRGRSTATSRARAVPRSPARRSRRREGRHDVIRAVAR